MGELGDHGVDYGAPVTAGEVRRGGGVGVTAENGCRQELVEGRVEYSRRADLHGRLAKLRLGS